MFRCATQSLQSFPLDTFPLPRRPNGAGFGRRSRRAARGKSGGAGFGQHPRKSRRGKSGGAGFGRRPQRSRRRKSGGAGFGRRPQRSRRRKSGGAGFGRRPRRSRRPTGRFRRPPESILLTAEDDKSRRNRCKYNHDVLNLFCKAANLVVFEFVGLPDNLELTGLRANGRSL